MKKMKNIVLWIILIAGFLNCASSVSATNPDLELLRKKAIDKLMVQKVDEQQIRILISTIREDGSWPDINYMDLSRTGYDNGRHLNNIWKMCAAWKVPSSPLTGNEDLLKAIGLAMKYWTTNDFIAGNWHTNEKGNPNMVKNILFLMDTDLAEEQKTDLSKLAQRANLNSWGARPGGDYVGICGIMADMALFNRDEAALKTAIDSMAAQIEMTSGRGIKADMSFHHRTDRVTSILTYGTGYVSELTDWAFKLSGTQYSFPAANINFIIDYYLDGICKSLVHGKYRAPGLVNREMSRKGALDPVNSDIPKKLMAVSDYRKQELQNIVKIRNEEQIPNLTYNRFFWHSEYAIHQRPGYYSTVRMFSSRNNTMEYPHNMESLKHHHYADGANFVSVTGEEYYNIFPVWDWQKIPGTTVVQKPSLPSYTEIVKEGKTAFVGAVSDGTYGAAVFDFESPLDPLKAKKSWFFFDSEYVCLGAGINSTSNYPVTTTLNQCLLDGKVLGKAGNETTSFPKGEHKLSKVSWVLHDAIAYLFPIPTDISLNNKSYTGSWSDLVKRTSINRSDVETKDLFSLWIDHGKQPQNASYAYIVAPRTDISAGDPAAALSKVKILSNTPQIQAVEQIDLNITQIVYYEPGTLQLTDGTSLTALQPGMVIVTKAGGNIEQISVADPGRKLHTFQLTVSSKFVGSGADWKSVWNKQKKVYDIHFDLPSGDYAGQSMTIKNNSFEPYVEKENSTMANAAFDKKDSATETDRHFVGEKYGGGIVFWVDETGTHGLIAAKEDQINAIPWKNGASKLSVHFGDHGDRLVNALGDGIGAGQMNTAIIVSQLNIDDVSGNFAAKVCANYQSEGYGDWYLPSKAELNKMYQLKDLIGGFGAAMYWSSTEFNVGFVWCQNFNGYGGQFTDNKASKWAVRCIRRF